MKTVIAIDSLKGSLSSEEAGNAIKDGIKRVFPNCDIVVKALADGGEGTIEALTFGNNGIIKNVVVSGPGEEKVNASYGITNSGKTAVIEIAKAAGINLVSDKDKNPLKTTTYGVGELIKDAINNGIRDFIVGIGGSVTNDCGIGMLSALGWKFIDKNKKCVPPNGGGLKDILLIDDTNVISELKECKFVIACDVTNPLCGQNGASHIYGKQKGADEKMRYELDANCKHFAGLVKATYGIDNENVAGTGAAGGLGYGFITFLNGELKSGIKIVLEQISIEDDIKDADYVVTGEGRIDFQTSMGKAPAGVAELAKKYGAVVIGLSGCIGEGANECNANGIDAFFSILKKSVSLEEAMDKENATENMGDQAEQVFRLIKAINKN